MLQIPVQYNIWDKPLHKTSGLSMLVIWYEYRESQGLSYICIGQDWKPTYCIPYELESPPPETFIWFLYQDQKSLENPNHNTTT